MELILLIKFNIHSGLVHTFHSSSLRACSGVCVANSNEIAGMKNDCFLTPREKEL